MESNFKPLNKNVLNIYENVHLFFYTYLDNKLNVLLTSKVEEDVYQEFESSIIPSDGLPTFAISRIMATTYRGLFTDSNIEKIKNKEEIMEGDLASEEFHWTSIWQNEAFLDWLDKISANPIQYDSFNGKMIYLIEIPQIDTEFLNKNLANLNFKHKFSYFTYQNSHNNINVKTEKILNSFNFDTYIKETVKLFNDDLCEYFIIIACKKPGSKKDQAGFFHFPALIPGIYRKNNEKWIYLVASTDPLPDDALLKKTKAIIIPGSDLNIYSDIDFLRKTEDFIVNVFDNYKHIKYLGLCFGMQLLVNALGGKVENMGVGKFIVGAEKLNLNSDFWNLNFAKVSGVEKSESFVIHQAHGDHVTIMPNQGKLNLKSYASSESCTHELIASDDEKVFCLQGHAEYSTEFSISRASNFLCLRQKLEVNVENMIKVKEEFIKNEKYPALHCDELRKICFSFLKN